jgi:hypothetical protein
MTVSRADAEYVRARALPFQRVQEELWLLFLGHGFLCRPRIRRPYGVEMGWEVRFVGLTARARTRLDSLLKGYRLPEAHVTGGRRNSVVSVPGRRAVWVFERLWRRFAPGSRSGIEPPIVLGNPPLPDGSEEKAGRGVEPVVTETRRVVPGDERLQQVESSPDDAIPF